MSDVIVYAEGFVSLSACMPEGMAVEAATEEINRKHHPGIGCGWQPSEAETFSGGESNPCPCNTDPSRVHRLYNC